MESSERVAQNCAANIKLEEEKGLKKWAPCFYPESLEQLASQWEEFGKDFASNPINSTGR